jgi:choline dehydrogenase-like flavoprotein
MMLGTPKGKDIIEDSTPPLGVNKLPSVSSDEDIDALVRKVRSTTFNPAGTAAMGSVVDVDLKLIGIDGLRVVVASVLPVPVAAHLQVALYALAEQVADIDLRK